MLNANFINTVFSPLFLFFIFARKFSQYFKLFHPYFLFFLKIKKVSLPFRKHFVDQQQNIFIHSFIHLGKNNTPLNTNNFSSRTSFSGCEDIKETQYDHDSDTKKKDNF